jgi:hypothetical protein
VTFVPHQLEYLSTLAIKNFNQPLKQIIHKNVTIPGEDLNEFDIDLLVLSPHQIMAIEDSCINTPLLVYIPKTCDCNHDNNQLLLKDPKLINDHA